MDTIYTLGYNVKTCVYYTYPGPGLVTQGIDVLDPGLIVGEVQ